MTDAEYITFHPGPLFTNPSGERFYTDRLDSRQMPTAANRWSGFNRGGYNTPRVDGLLDQLNVTIDPRERLPLHRELLQAQMGDVALMPLYWEVVPTLMLKGVTGPKHVRNDSTHNIFEWNKQ
jgi:peptide/nickel transport system substrate-binding protein